MGGEGQGASKGLPGRKAAALLPRGPVMCCASLRLAGFDLSRSSLNPLTMTNAPLTSETVSLERNGVMHYTGAENYRRFSNHVFWVQFARCNSLSARAWHASGEAQLVNRFRLTYGQSISVDSWSIEFG